MDQGTRSRPGWGKHWWRWGHSVIECCEFEKQDIVWIFDRAWPVLLPCAKCRRHYCSHVKKFGTMAQAVDSSPRWRAGARRWLIRVHNAVNKHLGKKILTFEEARVAIRGFRGVRFETPFVIATVRTNLRLNKPQSAIKQKQRLNKLIEMLKSKDFNIKAHKAVVNRVNALHIQ